jgi:hypothetical protein
MRGRASPDRGQPWDSPGTVWTAELATHRSSAAPLRSAAGRHMRRPPALGGPGRRAPTPHATGLRGSARLTRHAAGCCAVLSSRRSIVLLPAAASRSLRAVASHAIGFAEPRPGVRSPGFRRLRGRRGGMKTESLRCAAARAVSSGPGQPRTDGGLAAGDHSGPAHVPARMTPAGRERRR